jgi:hypothetical protein
MKLFSRSRSGVSYKLQSKNIFLNIVIKDSGWQLLSSSYLSSPIKFRHSYVAEAQPQFRKSPKVWFSTSAMLSLVQRSLFGSGTAAKIVKRSGAAPKPQIGTI